MGDCKSFGLLRLLRRGELADIIVDSLFVFLSGILLSGFGT